MVVLSMWIKGQSIATMDPDRFSELPDELILKIFSYLAHSELAKCLRVCQKWHRLANDDSLWYEVEISSYILPCGSGSVLSAIARQHPNLHTLAVKISSDLWDSRLASREIQKSSDVWTSFINLSKVFIYDSPWPGKGAIPLLHALPDMLSACYRTLTCFRCEGSTALGREQFQLLFSNPSVRYRELSIAHCPNIGDIAIFQAQFNSNFSKCLENLELLNLDGIGTVWRTVLSDGGIIAMLSACPRLKSLYCDGENMTDKSSEHIQKLSNLEHLSISFCSELTDKSLECFSKLKNLTSLYLKRGDEFTNQGFENLFDGLCVCSDSPYQSGNSQNVGRLRKVCLIECKLLRDSGLMQLARNFPHLVHLDLSWCWNLSDIGLEAVARNCVRIETLRLVGLKNAMCVPVLSVSLPRLRVLDLQQTDLVDDEELGRLKEAKPWIKITNYYGDPVIQNESSEPSDSDV